MDLAFESFLIIYDLPTSNVSILVLMDLAFEFFEDAFEGLGDTMFQSLF